MSALRPVLSPAVAAWNRTQERRSWLVGDEDPEQVAREAIAELKRALEGLYAIRDLLAPPKPDHEAGR